MRSHHLPKRVPVGTKYVIEGKSLGEQDELHIFSRYLVFPDGRLLDLPADSPESGLVMPTARNFTHH